MKFLNFQANNLFSLGRVTLPIGERGLVLVTGYSHDEKGSNGSGKSSLTSKGIIWTLYGKTPGKITADAVVNANTGNKKAWGQISWEANGQEHIVQRGRNPNYLMYQVDKVDVSSRTVKDTQDMIDTALGCDFNSYIQTSFFGQGRPMSYPELTPAAQKEVLSEILPLRLLGTWLKIAQDHSSVFNARHVQLATKEEVALDRYNHCNITFKGTLHQLNTTEREVENEIAHLNKKIEYLSADSKAEDIGKVIIEHLDNIRDLGPITSIRLQLNSNIAKVKDERIATSYLNAELIEIRSNLQIRKQSLAMSSVKQECTTCKRPFSIDDKILMKTLGGSLQVNKLESEINLEIATQYYDTHYAAEKLLDLRIEALNKAEHKLKTEEASLSLAKKDLELVELSIASEKAKLETEIDRKRNKLTLAKSSHEDASKQLFEARVLRDEAVSIREWDQTQWKIVKKWVRLFGTEMPLKLFEAVCPFLTLRTNIHLKGLGNEQLVATFKTVKRLSTGDYREEFCVGVESSSGAKDYMLLSGGEKQMVSFAVGLALADLAGAQTSPIPFLILDEPFTELDPRNCQNIIEYLTSYGKSKDTVFLVSNDEELKGLVPNRVHVVKQDGVTELEGDLSHVEEIT